jgi:MFS family permease
MSASESRGRPVLMGALVVDSIGSGLFIPLALIYFVELTEVSQITVGVILSAAGVLAFPLPAWAGYLADRFGALPLIIGSHCLQAVGFVGYGLADHPGTIFLTVLLTTAGVRIFWSTIFTAVADFADGSSSTMTKDLWFAWVNTFRLSGFGTGMLLSGIAVSVGGDLAYLTISSSTAACYLVSAVALALFVRMPRRVAGSAEAAVGYRTMLRDRQFLGFTAVNVLFAMSSRMLALGLPSMVLYDLHGPGWLTSTVLVGNIVLLAALSAPVTKLLQRFRRTRVIIFAGGLWTAWSFAFASIAPGSSVWLLMLLVGGATLLFTVAEVMYGPSSMALVNAIAPTAARGRYLAAFQYSFVASGIICPLFFTTLFAVRPELPWMVLGLVNLCALTGMYFFELSVRKSALGVAKLAG